MARCKHIKADNSQCKRRTRSSSGLCWVHDPTTAKIAQQISSKRNRQKGAAQAAPPSETEDVPRETSPSSPSPSPARTVDTVDDLNELVGDALVQVHNGEMSVKRAEAIARMAKVKKTLMTDRLGTKDRIQRLTDVELVSETQALLVELQRDIVDPIDEEEEAA